MRIQNQFYKSIGLTAMLFAGFTAGAIAQDTSTEVNPDAKAPVILSTTPASGAVNVDQSSVIEITFSSEMDETTINGTTLLLQSTSADSKYDLDSEMPDDQLKDRSAIKDSENNRQNTTGTVNGTISYSDKVVVFTPDMELKEDATYTFTVTKGVKSLENIALENNHNWTFSTTGTSNPTFSDQQNVKEDMNRNEYNEGTNEYSENTTDTTRITLSGEKNLIDLGNAGLFVILAKTNINNESESSISGQIGEGSVADSLKKDKDYSDSAKQPTSGQAEVKQSNQKDTSSTDVTEAIEDMMSAYGDVSMQNEGDITSHKNESFQSTVLSPGVHEWSDSLHIESDVTLSGSAEDVWIIMVGDNLTIDENTVFTLAEGARAENVFWYVEGQVTIGKNSNFEGIILSMNEITLEKGAKMNGRMFSQSSITLDDNTITEPRGLTSQTTSTNE